jgi:hypothetical protein
MFVAVGLLWQNFEKPTDCQAVAKRRSALLLRWASFCICLIACEFCKIQPDLSCRFFCLAMLCNTLFPNAICKVVAQLDFAIPASCEEVGVCCVIELDYRFCLLCWPEVALWFFNELLLFMCTCLESLASAHARTKPPTRDGFGVCL